THSHTHLLLVPYSLHHHSPLSHKNQPHKSPFAPFPPKTRSHTHTHTHTHIHTHTHASISHKHDTHTHTHTHSLCSFSGAALEPLIRGPGFVCSATLPDGPTPRHLSPIYTNTQQQP